MESIPPPGGGEAVCANHPLLAAVFTCERCGCFGCESCQCDSLPGFCQPCGLRVSASLDDSLTVGALLGDSFRLLPRNLQGFCLLFGVEFAGTLVLQAVPNPEQHPYLLILATQAFSAIATVAFLFWTESTLRQEPGVSLATALNVGLSRFPSLVLMRLLSGIAVGVGTMVLILPGLYIAIRLSLATPLLVLEDRGPLRALNESYELTRKHWKTLGSVFLVVGSLFLGCMFVAYVISAILSGMGGLGRGLGLFLGNGVAAIGSALFHTAFLLAWMRISRSLEPR